ncbi:MAG: tRNA (adenosine(37)-N6)-threonylcarbamoyltransferase complex ATPase subunit type 1 TsaE, partial [Planctomycetota bacterium]
MKQAAHILDSDSVEQTRRFGQRIGRLLHGGEVIALTGQLGAGKTQLVKGIATGNGHQDASQVTSPTFTLVHEYSGRLY